ncbi:MAG TPA: DUF4124 domain-containing protein [Spongiibacteraceae bacterium]
MKHPLALAITLATAMTTPLCAQTIYQSKDAKGNPVFTDQPKPGAKEVELKSINTTPAVTPGSAPANPGSAFSGYSHIGVAVPNSIPNGLAPVTIGISTEPALQPGHSWQLKLDGSVIASGTESSTTVASMPRGDHTLAVDILAGGSVIASSESTAIFVFWPSKNR